MLDYYIFYSETYIMSEISNQKLFKVYKQCRVPGFQIESKFSKGNDAFLDWIMEKPEHTNQCTRCNRNWGAQKKVSSEGSGQEPSSATSTEGRSIIDMIPDLDNTFYGKGRDAELPSMLKLRDDNIEDSLLTTHSDCLSEKDSQKSRKRDKKAEQKGDLNLEVDLMFDSHIDPVICIPRKGKKERKQPVVKKTVVSQPKLK